ncbi:MAG: ABC-F family ATP-binding cassette domain-containing protein, partial [Geobacteraceae bacterium]|nr:ABC-F family ATP-binding cassette domain-containing protein [Geobacteraceae bacterium]
PKLRDILGAFLFSGDDIHKQVSVLSGGERNRLALAKMLLRSSNLLLMDEPTNHLDLNSKEVLLDALKGFDGTVVFVSHDRYFVNALATRVVEVDGGGVENYFGDYEYYLGRKAGTSTPFAATPAAGSAPSAGAADVSPASLPPLSKDLRLKDREEEKRRKRDDQSRQKRMNEVESLIASAEKELAGLEDEMNAPGFFDDPERGLQGGERHAALNTRLVELYGEWEGLSC